jgi:exodeoxyribonuclease V alpha subunit
MAMQTISGIIRKIIFSNPSNYWSVMKFQTEEDQNVTVVGKFVDVKEGMHLKVDGIYRTNPKYGTEFAAESYITIDPSSSEEIMRYLGSGLIRGIGPVIAERIVECFGEKTIDIFDKSPEKLLKVEGIGKKKLKSILESWEKERGRRNIIMKLKSMGLSTSQSIKIMENYGADAFQKVSENPYCLAEDVWGIGFKTADDIAEKLGIARNSPKRIRAGMLFILKQASQEGHCYVPEEELVEKASDLMLVDQSMITDEIHKASKEGILFIENKFGINRAVYLTAMLRAEKGVADGLNMLSSQEFTPDRTFIERGIQLIEKTIGFPFSENQKKAIRFASTQKITVITGGPGTGKTTIVRAILMIALQTDRKTALCAPTGRAAKRMSEACSHEAKTIHRLLEYNPVTNSFKKNEKEPLDAGLIIVDEASMVDIFLFHSLLSAMKPSARLVLVGDADQLPSVGPGNLLADIIDSKAIPAAFLHEIFRQEQGSLIIKNAHHVISGENIEIPPSDTDKLLDFYFIQRENPEDVIKTICDLITERIPLKFQFDPVSEIQVISPMHRGELGADNLNRILRDLLNPDRGREHDLKEKESPARFRIGDKIMQLKNDYDKDVFNGDVGTVLHLDRDEGTISVDFYGRTVKYLFHELDEMALAYAMTIHKSQGSEYHAVIVVLHTQHYLMLQRNLLYTAITRAKKLLIIVGNNKAVHLAIRNNKIKNRYTMLKNRLMNGKL